MNDNQALPTPRPTFKVYALWHGGNGSYSYGSVTDDLEGFPSIAAACDAFSARARNGYYFKQSFAFVNRAAESVFTPCVDESTADNDGPSMWLYFYDPTDSSDPYPDRIIEFGPRGGVRVTRA